MLKLRSAYKLLCGIFLTMRTGLYARAGGEINQLSDIKEKRTCRLKFNIPVKRVMEIKPMKTMVNFQEYSMYELHRFPLLTYIIFSNLKLI